MRDVKLILAVLAVILLAAAAASAAPPAPSGSPHVTATLVAHHGRSGHYRGHQSRRYDHHYGSRSHGYGSQYRYIPRVTEPPRAYHYYRMYPSYPPHYGYPRYPYGGIHYYGQGFGISIGF